LYPATLRGEYAEERLAVLSEVLTENQKKGVMAPIVSTACESTGLPYSAPQEHVSVITVPFEKSFSRSVTMRSISGSPKPPLP
jgi:hypothetical protein